jgi:hypothetical protein
MTGIGFKQQKGGKRKGSNTGVLDPDGSGYAA